MKRLIVVVLTVGMVWGCISKPAPWKPDGGGVDGAGEVSPDSTGGQGDIGIPDFGPGTDNVTPEDIPVVDVVDVKIPEDLTGDVVDPDVPVDLVDVVDMKDIEPEDTGDDVDAVEPDVPSPDPGPAVVHPMVFFGKISGGGLSLTPVLVAGQSGQQSSGGGLILNGGIVTNNSSE